MSARRVQRSLGPIVLSSAIAGLLLACAARSTQSSVRPSAPSAPRPPVVAPAVVLDETEALARPSLAEHFQGRLELGLALEPYALKQQGAVIAHHFRRMTAENAMKLGSLQPRAGVTNYEQADRLAAFAREHHFKMTGHALVWHQMQPGWWFKDGKQPATKEQMSERLRSHIFAVVERYADVVDNWDVVNEAISDLQGQIYRDEAEKSLWMKAFGGPDYIAQAFRFAAEATAKFAPTTKLYYNDYNVEQPEKRVKILGLLQDLRKQGLRVDGVGTQAHFSLTSPTPKELAETIELFGAQGFLVKISELDVSVYSRDDWGSKTWQAAVPFSPALDRQIAERYSELFQVFLAHHAQLSSVTFWGLSDDHTWLNGFPVSRPNYPLLFDRSHRPKAAFDALLEL